MTVTSSTPPCSLDCSQWGVYFHYVPWTSHWYLKGGLNILMLNYLVCDISTWPLYFPGATKETLTLWSERILDTCWRRSWCCVYTKDFPVQSFAFCVAYACRNALLTTRWLWAYCNIPFRHAAKTPFSFYMLISCLIIEYCTYRFFFPQNNIVNQYTQNIPVNYMQLTYRTDLRYLTNWIVTLLAGLDSTSYVAGWTKARSNTVERASLCSASSPASYSLWPWE